MSTATLEGTWSPALQTGTTSPREQGVVLVQAQVQVNGLKISLHLGLFAAKKGSETERKMTSPGRVADGPPRTLPHAGVPRDCGHQPLVPCPLGGGLNDANGRGVHLRGTAL